MRQPRTLPEHVVRLSAAAACIAICSVAAAQDEAAPQSPPAELNQQTFDDWLEFALPSEEEVCWQDIAWRSSLAEAVHEANRLRKPILLWAMNGHPLGCV